MNININNLFLPACIIKFNGDILAYNALFNNHIYYFGEIEKYKQRENIASIFFQKSDLLDLLRISKLPNSPAGIKRKIYKIKFLDKSGEEDNLYCDIISNNIEYDMQKCLALQFYILTEFIEQHRKDMEIIKELQNKVANTIVSLEKDKITAEESSNKKSIFLASMSHELRTPLNSILGFTELLISEHVNNPDISEKLQFIYNECKRLNFLIDDILDFTKISDNKLKFNLDYFSLTELITKLNNMFKARCSDKNIIFEIIKGSNTPDFIKGDSLRLLQILVNLIGNSIKFTPSGKITVSIKYDFKSNILEMSVKDTGIGIPEERQTNIFNPFDASADNVQRKYGGTGLGLSITLNLIKLMRGNLFLESKAGQGANFTFKLPSSYRMSESEKYGNEKIQEPLGNIRESADDSVLKEDVSSGYSEKKKILIVDDNPNILKLLHMILTKLNFVPVKAVNGHEALMILERDSNFAAMLTDLIMPEMDGETAVKKIREIPELKDLKIAAISAKNCRKDELQSVGFNDYIKKPFTKSQIVEVLKRFGVEVVENKNTTEDTADIEKNKIKTEQDKMEKTRLVFPPADKDFILQFKSEIENSKYLDNRDMVKLTTDFAFNLSDKLNTLLESLEGEDFKLLAVEIETISAVSEFLELKSLSNVCSGIKSKDLKSNLNMSGVLKLVSSIISGYGLIADFYSKRFAVKFSELDIEAIRKFNKINPVNIFIAEDDAAMRKLMQLKFEKINGCKLFLFENGESLLEAVAEGNMMPDIIFTDIMMTGITGFETAKKLRSEIKFENPIIALTGSTDIKDADMEKGKLFFNEWLVKPVETDVLIEAINKFSGKRKVMTEFVK